jgi:hypothetical protein
MEDEMGRALPRIGEEESILDIVEKARIKLTTKWVTETQNGVVLTGLICSR